MILVGKQALANICKAGSGASAKWHSLDQETAQQSCRNRCCHSLSGDVTIRNPISVQKLSEVSPPVFSLWMVVSEPGLCHAGVHQLLEGES